MYFLRCSNSTTLCGSWRRSFILVGRSVAVLPELTNPARHLHPATEDQPAKKPQGEAIG